MTHLVGYIGVIIVCVFFMLYFNGLIGRALAYAINGAVVISILLIALSRKRFTVKLESMSGVCECGSLVEFEVTLEKKGFCFLPYIEICLNAGQNIHMKTALLFRKSVTVKGSFRPVHSGLNKIVLGDVMIGDFMGTIRRRITFNQETHMAVLPRVIEYDGPEVAACMLPSEEEEVEEGISVLNGGLPGYEHREYVEGDSPRRINYKLSAKRDKLMVRLDESSGCATTNLYIFGNAMPVCCDKAFALATQLIIHGGTVKITHKGESRTASTPETLDLLREWLAFREFAESPDEISGDIPPADTMVTFARDGEVALVIHAA